MANPGYVGREHLLEEAIEAVRRHGNISAAARALNLPRETLKHRLHAAARYGLDGSVPKPPPPGQVIAGTSTLYRLNPETGAEEILKWVRTKEDPNWHALHDAICDAFDAYKGTAKLPPAPKHADDDLLALYPLADFHLGLYAWGAEAGEDWDVDKACRLLRRVMGELVALSPPAGTAVLLNLGDFFHTDTSDNRTAQAGHPLDVDTRYARVLTFGVELIRDMIELCAQKHRKVIVRNLKGNHDYHSAIALTAALGSFFHGNDRIIVDASPAPHWSYRHGRTLLGATHGDMLKKPEQMAMLLAAARAEDWGQTRYRYFHYGHVHHASAKEVGGVLVESHRTLAPKDAWHAAAGYVSGRAMSVIVYSAERGEVARITHNIPHWSEG